MKLKQKYPFSLLLTAFIAVLSFSCKQQPEKKVTGETPNVPGEYVNQEQLKPADKTVLTGNWIRTDAEYRIQIADLHNDGKMKAGYFNPKSINVAEAKWTNKDGMVKIYMELRDVNYPGSKYNLEYIKSRDMLSGEYYQAVEGATYKVEFTRAK